MNLVEIEAKKTVILAAKKAALDAANLEIMPIQVQIGKLEGEAHRIALKATEVIARCDGQLAVLDDLAKELLPKPVEPEVSHQ